MGRHFVVDGSPIECYWSLSSSGAYRCSRLNVCQVPDVYDSGSQRCHTRCLLTSPTFHKNAYGDSSLVTSDHNALPDQMELSVFRKRWKFGGYTYIK